MAVAMESLSWVIIFMGILFLWHIHFGEKVDINFFWTFILVSVWRAWRVLTVTGRRSAGQGTRLVGSILRLPKADHTWVTDKCETCHFQAWFYLDTVLIHRCWHVCPCETMGWGERTSQASLSPVSVSGKSLATPGEDFRGALLH